MSNQIVWKILSVWHRSSCLNVTDSEDEFLFGPTIWNHEGSILSLDPFDECIMFFFCLVARLHVCDGYFL